MFFSQSSRVAGELGADLYCICSTSYIARKIKCNGNLDGCAHCAEKDQKCRYEAVPDDEKLKARSYKRQLIQRRQQTRVYWDRRQLTDAMMFAAAYVLPAPEVKAMAPYPMGLSPSQPTAFPSYAHMQQQQHQLSSPFSSASSSSPMEQDFNPYFASITSPDSSSRLQSVTGTSSFSQPIPAPLVLEHLNYTPSLSSSLSSPTLSVSSSSSSLLTPMSECFSEIKTPLSATFPLSVSAQDHGCAPPQYHLHGFAGGLELYNVPCMAPVATGITSSNFAEDFAMATPAPSADSSMYSSPEHFLQPLPTTFDFESSLEPTVATSTLAGALA